MDYLKICGFFILISQLFNDELRMNNCDNSSLNRISKIGNSNRNLYNNRIINYTDLCQSMKPLSKPLSILLLIVCFQTGFSQSNNNQNMKSFNDKGEKAPSEWFTGTVWLNRLINPEESYNVNSGIVTFEPKTRTNWHSHTNGQILFVTEGIGYYQEQGKPIQLIQKGDVVKIPQNVKHWHGASHQSQMRHIAMITEIDKDKTEWFEPVSDKDYNNFRAPVSEVENNLSPAGIMNHEKL